MEGLVDSDGVVEPQPVITTPRCDARLSPRTGPGRTQRRRRSSNVTVPPGHSKAASAAARVPFAADDSELQLHLVAAWEEGYRAGQLAHGTQTCCASKPLQCIAVCCYSIPLYAALYCVVYFAYMNFMDPVVCDLVPCFSGASPCFFRSGALSSQLCPHNRTIEPRCHHEAPTASESRLHIEVVIGLAPVWARDTLITLLALNLLWSCFGFKLSQELTVGLVRLFIAPTRVLRDAGDAAEANKTVAVQPNWKSIVGDPLLGHTNAATSQVTWAQLREYCGVGQRQLFSAALIKLAFWHLSQPLAYLWVLWAYKCQISDEQRSFAVIVALREGVYLSSLVAGIVLCPVYLLLDLECVWKESDTSRLDRVARIAGYVLTPHNYVMLCLINRLRGVCVQLFLVFTLFLQLVADLASCFALALLISQSEHPPVALLIGYCLSAGGFVLFFGPALFVSCCVSTMNTRQSRIRRCTSGFASIAVLFGLMYVVLAGVLLLAGFDVACMGYLPGSPPPTTCRGVPLLSYQQHGGYCHRGVCNCNSMWRMGPTCEDFTPFTINNKATVTSLAFSPDGQILGSGSADNAIRLWHKPASGGIMQMKWCLLQMLKNDTQSYNSINAVVFSPDGSLLASGSGSTNFPHLPSTVNLWRRKTSPNGTYWEARQTLAGHTQWVSSVAFSPDGHLLASASADNTIKLWHNEASTWKLLQTLTNAGPINYINCVAFSPSGRLVAAGFGTGGLEPGSSAFVKLWGAPDASNTQWQELQMLPTAKSPSDSVNSLSFSPDGNVLAAGIGDYSHGFAGHSDGDVIDLWTILNDTVRCTNPHAAVKNCSIAVKQQQTISKGRHTNAIESVAFSVDGSVLASGADDDTIKLWSQTPDTSTWTLMGTLGQPGWVRPGGVSSVIFSADGRSLASGWYDKTIKVWS